MVSVSEILFCFRFTEFICKKAFFLARKKNFVGSSTTSQRVVCTIQNCIAHFLFVLKVFSEANERNYSALEYRDHNRQ